MFIDFAELKERVSIADAGERLNLRLSVSQNQLRGPCPRCKSGGDRALAITPAKNLFFCFADKKGGDQIQLAAHIRDESTKDAAEWLGGKVQDKGTSTGTSTVNRKDHATSGFAALDYLEPEHDAVLAVGFDPVIAKALGIGYAVKGMMRGTVAIPLRLEDGSIAGYIGVTEAKLPTKWHGIDTNIIPFGKKGAA